MLKRLIVISTRDADFGLSNRHILTVAGYIAEVSPDLHDVMLISRERLVHGVLLDGQVPGDVRLCQDLKKNSHTTNVKVVALLRAWAANLLPAFIQAGIDEAFVCPVEPHRYLQAFRNLLLGDESEKTARACVGTGALSIDRHSHHVWWRGHEFHLGLIEFRLLHRLMQEPGRVIGRKELIAGAWPPGIFVDPRTVNVHVARLRKSLIAVAGRDLIRTVRGVGYAFVQEPSGGDVLGDQPVEG